jgi:hypothetical protein
MSVTNRKDHMTDIDAMTPHELTAGLMRGDRTDMRLGYDPKSAALAAIERKKLSPEQARKLIEWAQGFHDGMYDAMAHSEREVQRGPYRPEMADSTNYMEGRVLGRAENGFFLYPSAPVAESQK